MFRPLLSLYERLALNAYVLGDYPRALRWLRLLESKEGDSIRVLRNLGVVLLASGEVKAAEACLRKEEALYGPSFHRHAALADLAYSQGDRAEAARRYALALAEPEAKEGKWGVASLDLLEKRLANSRDAEAFRRGRLSLEAFARGEEERDSGEAKKALASFEEAADLDPTNWPALNNAGSIVLNVLHDPERAVGLFSKALALSPSAQVARNLELAKEAATKGGKR
jgi:tetratricopeptide (TPR) repeat protein